MLRTSSLVVAFAALLGAGFTTQAAGTRAAEAGRTAPPDSPTSHPMVHVEGCVFTEKALTATMPIMIPTGSTETYVLTHVKPIAGPLTEAETSKTVYGLDKVDQEQLRELYGKRVGVTGHVGTGHARPQLDVVGIREISGGCPVLPSLQ